MIVAAAVLFAGCEDKPKMVKADEVADAGKKAVDPALAKAVAAAKAEEPGSSAAAAGSNEPPENGVFAPGAADKAMAKGAAPKLVMGGDGAAPRVKIASMQPPPGFKRPAEMQFSLRTGSGGLPPLSVSLELEAKKPKQGKTDKTASGPAKVDMVASIAGAKVADATAGIPQDFQDQISKLKGSHIAYAVAPDGAGSDFRVELPKGADPALENIVSSLAETMATLTVPFPDKPVGTGAYWMVTSRETLAGIDVVAYRLVKVESIAGDTLTLSVGTKRYAASDKIDVPGLPADMKDVSLASFDASSDGTLQVQKDTPFPISASLTQTLMAPLTSPKMQGKPVAGLRAQTKLDFTLGGVKKK